MGYPYYVVETRFYVALQNASDWTQRCARHADGLKTTPCRLLATIVMKVRKSAEAVIPAGGKTMAWFEPRSGSRFGANRGTMRASPFVPAFVRLAILS